VILAARAHQAARPHQAAKEAPRSSIGEAPASAATPASGAAPASSATHAADPHRPAPAAAAQPITAALPRAGFWIRIGALLLDALLVGFAMGVLRVYHVELPVLAAYGAVMWKMRGSTVGGIVFDLRVVRLDGRHDKIAGTVVVRVAKGTPLV
jgi:uncharacterized RDD family membrane protein YckC